MVTYIQMKAKFINGFMNTYWLHDHPFVNSFMNHLRLLFHKGVTTIRVNFANIFMQHTVGHKRLSDHIIICYIE